MIHDLVTRLFGPPEPVSFSRRVPVCQQLTLKWFASKHQGLPVGHVFTTEGECIYEGCDVMRDDKPPPVPSNITGPFGGCGYSPGAFG